LFREDVSYLTRFQLFHMGEVTPLPLPAGAYTVSQKACQVWNDIA